MAWAGRSLRTANGCRSFLALSEHFHKYCSHAVGEMIKRSFWVWASFRLSHRPLMACSFAEASPIPKNPRSAWLQYFFKRSNFRGCDLTAEWLLAREHIRGAFPGAIPGNRTNLHTPRANLRDRVSKTQSAWGSTKAACHFLLGSWQTSNALALQASLCGSVTRRLRHFHHGNVNEPCLASRFSFACHQRPEATSRHVNQPPCAALVSTHTANPISKI
jgi:hypothetical protein